MTQYDFSKNVNGITVQLRLVELRSGNRSESRALVTFTNGDVQASYTLTSVGVGTVRKATNNGLEHIGDKYNFSTAALMVFHTPEEERKGSTNWIPTGSGVISASFFVDAATKDVKMTLDGYLIKR